MAGGIITTGAHPKALWPGVKNWFGRAYDEYEAQYPDLVEELDSDKAYEEEVESTGFGLATVKPQGEAITYDADSQGVTSRYTHVVYGIGYIVTEEELDDNLYADVSKRRAPDLAFSLRQTKENVVANKFNRAFNTSFTGADGKALCVTDHPSLIGNQSNRLTTDADFSESACEDLVTQIRQAKNSRGMAIKLQPVSLHVPVQVDFEAHRVLDSVLQNDTANNAINVLRSQKIIPKGIFCNQYFTNDSAWFIKTNARHGMKLFQRKAVAFKMDNDFDTSNAKAKATERYAVGWTDWRGYFGTQGV
jgi:hypothetical protein